MTKQCLHPLLPAIILVGVQAIPTSAFAGQCGVPIDFLTMDLPKQADAITTALETAYPGLIVQGKTLTLPSGKQVPFDAARKVSAPDRLENATVGDMFSYIYPLDFSLDMRKAPFHDPGRVRNESFYKALFFDNKKDARKSLTKIRYNGRKAKASFMVTQKHCVHVQLKAALTDIANLNPSKDKFLRKSGGSFNWRKISGTNRMSSHSFGTAVDINSQLGKYWKWAGVKPGKAVRYDNAIPKEIVTAFERRGFIWGGKWHHYDGMHFEYRPELILYSRLVSQ